MSKEGGLGIPGTEFALFHLKHDLIKKPVFHIYDLDEAYEIKSMDGGQRLMSRMLLMLAPRELGKEGSEMFSLISSSIIESEESMALYGQGKRKRLNRNCINFFINLSKRQNGKKKPRAYSLLGFFAVTQTARVGRISSYSTEN